MVYVRGVRPILSLSPLFYRQPKQTNSIALNIERNTIVRNGGQINERLLGPDGRATFSGRPMEVKYSTKGRWRIGDKDHAEMLRANGIYILVDEHGRERKFSAQEIDRMIKYRGLTDIRSNEVNYSHGFIYEKDVPG